MKSQENIQLKGHDWFGLFFARNLVLFFFSFSFFKKKKKKLNTDLRNLLEFNACLFYIPVIVF